MHQSVGVIVFTFDPENNLRILLRHNRPFDGYRDEWLYVFGSIEQGETPEQAAIREAGEELSVYEYEKVIDLKYKFEFDGREGATVAYIFAIKLSNIDQSIKLNKESIGYDWMLAKDAMDKIPYDDEKEAIKKLQRLLV